MRHAYIVARKQLKRKVRKKASEVEQVEKEMRNGGTGHVPDNSPFSEK
jgi:hypothetical protein